jgi:hypothetical protein
MFWQINGVWSGLEPQKKLEETVLTISGTLIFAFKAKTRFRSCISNVTRMFYR